MKFLLNLLLPAVILFAAVAQGAEVKSVTSPGGNVKVNVSVGEKMTYDLTFNGKTVLTPPTSGLRSRAWSRWAR